MFLCKPITACRQLWSAVNLQAKNAGWSKRHSASHLPGATACMGLNEERFSGRASPSPALTLQELLQQMCLCVEIPQIAAAPTWLAKQKRCEQHSTRGALPGLHCKEETSWGIYRNQSGVAVPSPMQCSCTHTLQTSLLRQSSPLVTAHFLLLLVTCPGHLLPALRGGATRSHCCSSIQHGHIPAPPCCNSTLLYLTE